MPVREPDRIVWRAPAVDCMFCADIRRDPIALRLFETDSGFVDWRCEAPAALVTLDLAGPAPIRGCGYVERLELTIPPWRLPVDELRWGRWMDGAADRSVVWIDWRGAEPRTWVFVDGVRRTESIVGDDRVSGGAATLMLARGSTLFSRSLSEIVDGIPALRAVVPASLLALRDVRWSSTGSLQCRGAASIEGHAIHELVTFR